MDAPEQEETFNPWSIVNLVFEHLVEEGLHPQFGGGDPGPPATALLVALGITPAQEGNRHLRDTVQEQLEQMRTTVLGER